MMGGNWVIKGPSAIQTCIQLSMNKKMEIVIFKTKIILEDRYCFTLSEVPILDSVEDNWIFISKLMLRQLLYGLLQART